jgi:hypothetical protein
MSLRDRSGMNRTATIASNTGASHSIADIHDGAMIVRSCSTLASKLAVISEIVTNWPDGSSASAATSSGELSTNTVAPSNTDGCTF